GGRCDVASILVGVSAAKRVVKIALFVIGGLVIAVVAALATIFINGAVVAGDSATAQEERLASVRADVAGQPGGVFEGWQEAAVDGRVSWDRVQSIATHNSYAVAPNGLQSFVLDVVQPGEAAKL